MSDETDKVDKEANQPDDELSEEVAVRPKSRKKTKKANKETPEEGAKIITKPVEDNRVIAVRGWFTLILVLANILLFVVMIKRYGMGALLQPSSQILLRMGADYGPLVAKGEHWRVVSCMFVHIGIVHLIVNMLALSDVGKVIERLYGSQKFLIIYFLSGIAGSLTSLLWHPTVVSAGASAAVFGVIGAQFIYVWVHHKYFTAAAIHSHYGALAMLVAYSLIAAFLNIPIDHAAHIGGFACGILAGFALIPRVMSNVRWQLEDIPRLAILLFALSGVGELTRQHLANIPVNEIAPLIHTHSKHHSQSKHSKSQRLVNSKDQGVDQEDGK